MLFRAFRLFYKKNKNKLQKFIFEEFQLITQRKLVLSYRMYRKTNILKKNNY